MAEPLVAGITPPEQRLIGWKPINVTQLGLPAGPLAADAAGNVVFAYVRKLRNTNVDPNSIFPNGFPNITGIPFSYQGNAMAYAYATAYLLAYYVTNGGTDPLPEDQMGELGDFPNWPQTGDTLVQKIYGWSVKDGGWDGYIQHLELRKVMQVQKWNNNQAKWFVYNQWGHDLTFVQDAPGSSGWSAGFDLGVWMNAHGAEIFAVFNAAMAAITTLTGYGAVLNSVSAAMKSLANVAVKGNFGELVKAIGAVGSAMAGLPGVAEFGAAFQAAGGAAALESVAFVAPLTKDVITTVMSAEGEVAKIVSKAKELMADAQKAADVLIQAGQQAQLDKLGLDRTAAKLEGNIRYLRETATPDHLKPWFDKAVAKARAGFPTDTFKPGHDVPYYAKGTWDQALALGTMVNVANKPFVFDLNTLTPQQKRAIFLGTLQVDLKDPNAVEFLRQANLFWSGSAGYTVRGWADYYKLR